MLLALLAPLPLGLSDTRALEALILYDQLGTVAV